MHLFLYNTNIMEKIALSSHFTYKKILIQCLGPILMMIFTSLYVAVDGIFVSNFVGGDAFAGLNLIAPVVMIVGGIGFMFGSGGGALASKLLGEKKPDEANKVFTMMIEISFLLVLVISVVMFFFIDDIVKALASISQDTTQAMIEQGTLYGKILILGQPIFAVQTLFHSFFVVNENPEQGFIQTFLSGLVNIAMDAILIVGCKLGVVGAAVGTILGYLTGTIYAFLIFIIKKNNLLKIKPCWFDFKVLAKCSTNGASDFIFNIASSVVSFIFNIQLLKYIGQNGVNAYGVIMYVSFIFCSIFIGIGIGMAPIIGYNYGAKNHNELKNVVKKSLILVGILSLIMIGLSQALAYPLATLFCKGADLIALSEKAIRLYSISFCFCGFCIFITSMFTALNNGFVSGMLSFLRTLVFELGFLFLLPAIFGADGLWWAIPACEALAFATCLFCYIKYHKRYCYY